MNGWALLILVVSVLGWAAYAAMPVYYEDDSAAAQQDSRGPA